MNGQVERPTHHSRPICHTATGGRDLFSSKHALSAGPRAPLAQQKSADQQTAMPKKPK